MSYSVEETIRQLSRPKASLWSVIVEGKDDASVYRYIEDRINNLIDLNIGEVDVYPCGGRDNLIEIFKRREEFKNTKAIFLADKDMWFFVDVPKDYEDIVFTDGYSIENDLYIESYFNSLLQPSDLKKFDNLIKELSIWFAFEVNRHQETGVSRCDVSIDKICPNNFFCPDFKEAINFINPPQEIVDFIYCEYTRALRGKNLFQALLRFLKPSGFSYAVLHRLGAKLDNPKIEELIEKIVKKFQEYD